MWFPHIRQPILTWLRDGEHWDSDTLTFRPHFAVRYPGRWVPVPWAPGSTTHLVQASDNPHVVATLIDASDGVRGMSIVPRITGSELAEALHTSPTDARVLGLPAVPPTLPLDLRDGDIVWDSLLYGEPDVSWTRLEDEASRAGMTCLSLLLTRSGAAGALFIWTSWLTGAVAMRRSSSSERSRSRSPSPLSSGPWIGRWRPDVDTPFERVTHQGHVDYRVLCPFRGWSPFYFVRPASSADELLSAVTDFSGDWSIGCTLVGATHPRLPLVALPKLGHRLVTCVVTSGVHTRAFLYPALARYHDLQRYCHKILGLSDMQLSCHPAIRPYALLSTAWFSLRHGDAFDMYPAESHHDFRATPRATFKYLGDLQHHHAWHQEFRVLYGGRVKVWHHDENHEYTCRQHKVLDGSIWTPVVGRFRAPRSLPGNAPWIPTHCVDDGWCHFVQAPESGRVGVLLQEPDRPVRCLSLAAPGNVGSAPPGWQLRSDITSRLERVSLRNGDVLVPVASSAHSAGIPAVFAGLFCRTLACLGLQIAGLFLGVHGMVLPPVDRDLAQPAHVGRYPWRLPRPMRVFHQAGGANVTGQLISPFAEPSQFQTLMPEFPVDDAYITLSGSEPAWFRDLMPVWPSQGQRCITFTPVPPCNELVCVLLVSREWQQAVLLPVRADLSWVSGYIRRTHRGSIVAVRGPISTLRPDRSPNEAVDWRNGDVLLAWEWHDSATSLAAPVLSNIEVVRHAALWMADFEVDFSLSVVLWRPGHRPLITDLPSPAQWSAAASTFVGRFARHFPGRWVPVPWAPATTPPRPDSVHLCLCADDDSQCNIILESCTAYGTYDQLDGRCFTVHQASTRDSLRRAFALPAEDIRLLGVPNQEEPFPPLRDGDIVHHTSSGAWPAGALSHTWLLLSLVRWPCSAALFLSWLMLSYPVPAQAAPTDPQHWLWSPYQGKLGPAAFASELSVELQLSRLEPFWKHGFVRTSACLEHGDTHWVPVLPSPDLVTVLVLGSPRPLALILPVIVSRSFLLRVLGRLFDQVHTIAGRHVFLSASAPASAEFTLCPGDVLDARACAWVPALLPARPQHFASIGDARDFGFWSHPLTFEGAGSALLWSSTTTMITLLPLSGRQWWDPDAGTLYPAFRHILDSWWPDPTQPRGYGDIIFFIPRDAAAGGDGTPGPRPGPLPTLGQPYGSTCSGAASTTPVGLLSPLAGAWFVFCCRWFSVLLTLTAMAAGPPPWPGPVCGVILRHSVRHSAGLVNLATSGKLLPQMLAGFRPLPTQLPVTFPATYHCAWQRYPVWGSGVPDEIFIATDGSGVGAGASAFAAWAFYRTGWYRVGWFAAALPHIPWTQLPSVPDSGRLLVYL